MQRTYTEAQYSTPSAREMIRSRFLRMQDMPLTPAGIEACAQYMSKTLRIGGIKVCRMLTLAAIEEVTLGRFEQSED